MTVGELRRAIEPMSDETRVVLFDGEGGSLDVYDAKIQFDDGEGIVVLTADPMF